MLRSFAALSLLAATVSFAHAGDPLPLKLRTLAYSMIDGATASFEPTFSDPAFTTPGDDGELPNVFDFGSTAPVFATGAGGRESFALSFADEGSASVSALNYGSLTFGSLVAKRSTGLSFGPNSFEETTLIDRDVTAFANFDFINDRDKRFGFDISVKHSTLRAAGFSGEETSSEVGASFSADVNLSSRLSFTGRAGVNLSENATRKHFNATANRATTNAGQLSLSESDEGFKDAFVQGGLTFAVSKNLEVKAGLGYARELGPEGDDAIMGTIGAAWKIRF